MRTTLRSLLGSTDNVDNRYCLVLIHCVSKVSGHYSNCDIFETNGSIAFNFCTMIAWYTNNNVTQYQINYC